MTTDEALVRLREDWALSREDDFLTDEPGWAVTSLMHGEYSERLGWGKTVIEAIEAAEAHVATSEREEDERRADYERRKAAGQLTPLEIASERAGELWAPLALQAIEFNSVLAGRVNRAYEDEIVGQGSTITIPQSMSGPKGGIDRIGPLD